MKARMRQDPKAHLHVAGENTTEVARRSIISLHGEDFMSQHPPLGHIAVSPKLTVALLPLTTLYRNLVNADPPCCPGSFSVFYIATFLPLFFF